jgi:SAM-dependent methyltransferase
MGHILVTAMTTTNLPTDKPQGKNGAAFFKLTEQQIVELKDYIIRRERSLDRDLLPYGNPHGKDVLVFGCGFGNEVLWAARHGARSILAIDLSAGLSPEPLRSAMLELGITYERYELRRENVHDTALREDRYDLIVTNGVFEHVMDLKGVLGAFRELLRPKGRVAIFADGLWYSSIGGHIGGDPWGHLWRAPRELHAELSASRWNVFCNQLNRMTVTDFIQAVRSSGMVVLQLKLGVDPNVALLPDYLPRIRERVSVSPTDLSIVSIGCELCFEENL